MELSEDVPAWFKPLRSKGRSDVAVFNDYTKRDTVFTVTEKAW